MNTSRSLQVKPDISVNRSGEDADNASERRTLIPTMTVMEVSA